MAVSHFHNQGFGYGLFHAQNSALSAQEAESLGVDVTDVKNDGVQLHHLVDAFSTVDKAQRPARVDAGSCRTFYQDFGDTNAIHTMSIARNIVTHEKSKKQFAKDIDRLSNIPVIVDTQQKQKSHVITTNRSSDDQKKMSEWMEGQFSGQDNFYHEAIQSLPFVFSQGVLSNAGYFEGLADRVELAGGLTIGKEKNIDDYVLMRPVDGQKQINISFVSVAYDAVGGVSDVRRRVLNIQSDDNNLFTYSQTTDVVAETNVAKAMQSAIQLGGEDNNAQTVQSVVDDLALIQADYKNNSGSHLSDEGRSQRLENATAFCQEQLQSTHQSGNTDDVLASHWHIKPAYHAFKTALSSLDTGQDALAKCYQGLVNSVKALASLDEGSGMQVKMLVGMQLVLQLNEVKQNPTEAKALVHNLAVLSRSIRPEQIAGQDKTIALNYFISDAKMLADEIEGLPKSISKSKDIKAIFALRDPSKQPSIKPKKTNKKNKKQKQQADTMSKPVKNSQSIWNNLKSKFFKKSNKAKTKKSEGNTYQTLVNKGLMDPDSIVSDTDELDCASLNEEAERQSVEIEDFQFQSPTTSTQLISDWEFFDHVQLAILEINSLNQSGDGLSEEKKEEVNDLLEQVQSESVASDKSQQACELLHALIHHQYHVEPEDSSDLSHYLNTLSQLDEEQRSPIDLASDDQVLMNILEAGGPILLNDRGKEAAKDQLRDFIEPAAELAMGAQSGSPALGS